jgi:hypothetical protein
VAKGTNCFGFEKKTFPTYVKVMRKKTLSIWMNLGYFLKTPFAKHYIFNPKTVQVAKDPRIALCSSMLVKKKTESISDL